ncbi:MAG: enolase C-terminal domain-like protein [Clostridia bacterium]|jgi:L-alanine-DL-glutamate epimerase-like enolase superfamily enzyme
MIKIENAACKYEIEPLITPFGFKGGSSSCIWTVSVNLDSKEHRVSGHSIQGVLWSDGSLYASVKEQKANEYMFSITSYVCDLLKGMYFIEPEIIFEKIFTQAMSYANTVLKIFPRKTFILNALVPIDNALRMLYTRHMRKNEFDFFASFIGISNIRQDKLALIPLITYNTSAEQIKNLADNGVCIFKIKIGADPDNDNDMSKMLNQDKKRLLQIHDILKHYKTIYTDTGYVAYYLDANGRYDALERMQQLLEYAKEIGAYERIVLLEEPFDEHNDIDVSPLKVTVAADESVHDEADAIRKIERGYKAFALKPIAKTITVTNQVAKIAIKNNINVFCADLTVTPMLVEINKNYASRLPAIEGMKIGIIESNGAQNYSNWKIMMADHPMKNNNFTKPDKGIFILDDTFYSSSGGIFEE